MKKLINALKVFWFVLCSGYDYSVKDEDIAADGMTFEELSNTIAKRQQELVDLNTKVVKTGMDLERVSTELSNKQKEVIDLKATNESLSKANSAGSAKLNKLIKDNNDKEALMLELNKSNTSLKARIDEYEIVFNNQGTEIAAKDLGLKNLTRIIAEKDEAITSLRQANKEFADAAIAKTDIPSPVEVNVEGVMNKTVKRVRNHSK